ncbi:MAG: SHOCT domain-containing protein [Candidatus Zixiibacteriota bacterium]
MFGHHYMMWGFGWAGTMIFWILVVVGIVFLVKWLLEKDRKTSDVRESAIDILKKRYARGEIDKEEFEKKKMDLSGS